MNPENINAIKEALAPVADKIGQGAEYGWEVLVAGQFAEGVATLILSCLGIVASVLVVHWGKNRYAVDDMDINAMMAMALGWLSLLVLSGFVYHGLIQVVAPEYAALKFLISFGR